MIVIDDQVLLDVLSGHADAGTTTQLERGDVFTTGCWYYRLGRAISAGTGAGSLSRRFEALDPLTRSRTLTALDDLPDEVGLVSLRDAVPVMRALRVQRPLNMINAEALAVALLLDASIVVSTDSPLLLSGAADLGVEYQLAR